MSETGSTAQYIADLEAGCARLKRDREAAEAHWIAKLAKLQARIGAVVAIATESRRKAVAGTGYGLIYSHEVLALLEEETP